MRRTFPLFLLLVVACSKSGGGGGSAATDDIFDLFAKAEADSAEAIKQKKPDAGKLYFKILEEAEGKHFRGVGTARNVLRHDQKLSEGVLESDTGRTIRFFYHQTDDKKRRILEGDRIRFECKMAMYDIPPGGGGYDMRPQILSYELLPAKESKSK
jgi:hypothetical protein